MSINIQADFINYVGDGTLEITEPKKFAKLSNQLLNLIRLQIHNFEDRLKLKLLIKENKIILLFDESDDKQTGFDEGKIENILMEGLEHQLDQVIKYKKLIIDGSIPEASKLNSKNNSQLSKAAAILQKIEETDIELVSSTNHKVKIPKLPKIDTKIDTFEPMSLDLCRITKPELIGPMEAVFISFINNKKVTAKLKITKADELVVCDMTFGKKNVDIEFEYLVNIKKSNHYIGSLISIRESNVIDTNIELEL